jgi:hypothetical protein
MVMNSFERDGISFQYPANWTLETDEGAGESAADTGDDEGGGGWVATVTSPDTAFLMVSLRPDAEHPADLADQTLDALKADYKEIDAENVMETVAGVPAIGFDTDFLTVDTVITCRVRALDTFAGPLLVLYQVSEFDRERNEPVLQAVIASLSVEPD